MSKVDARGHMAKFQAARAKVGRYNPMKRRIVARLKSRNKNSSRRSRWARR